MERIETVRKCAKCGESKALTEFYLLATGKRTYRCKECEKKRSKAYILKHHDRKLAYDLNRYYKNRDRLRARMSRYLRSSKGKAAVRRYKKANQLKIKTRDKTRYLVISGRLQKLPCEICGEKNVQAHHPDYSDPYRVRWLCRYHHMMVEGTLATIRI